MADLSQENVIAPHETFGLYELLQLKNICALKASGLTGNVADPKLRLILESDLKMSQQQIRELKDLIQTSGCRKENKV
ncbi:MAG: spore coat protein [Peptococcaceae bacterium]|nr:spore coat protein [Peptococcaceae bacterium]